MSSYLLQLEDLDDRMLLALQDEEELRSELISLIQDAHYSGAGWQLGGIWQWLGSGKLGEMELKLIAEHPQGNDFVDWEYEVIPAGGGDRVAHFVVIIDGRS